MVDRYLLRAERLMAGEDHEAVLEITDSTIAFQKEHNLTRPEEFHFKICTGGVLGRAGPRRDSGGESVFVSGGDRETSSTKKRSSCWMRQSRCAECAAYVWFPGYWLTRQCPIKALAL